MSINILIISHHNIATALVNAVKITYGKETLPLPIFTFEIQQDTHPESVIPQIKQLVEQLQYQSSGVLILTDIFGATPCNIALEIAHNDKARIITGLNLPMLIRIMNYPQLSLNELVKIALQGGQAGIIECAEGE